MDTKDMQYLNNKLNNTKYKSSMTLLDYTFAHNSSTLAFYIAVAIALTILNKFVADGSPPLHL